MDDYERQLKEYQNKIEAVKDYATTQLDRLVISISSGAIGLSVIYLKDFIALDAANGNLLLLLSWFCFAFAIIFSLASHLAIIKSVDYDATHSKLSDLLNKFTDIFNVISVLGVAVGVISLLLFMCYIVSYAR